MKRCGIYLLTHVETGRKYVGQSVDIDRRLRAHKTGRSCSRWLARAVKLHGWNSFQFALLEQCERAELNTRERALIELHNCVAPNGFNLTSGGRQQFVVSDDTRAKMRAAQANMSAETRAKIGAASKGRKFSAESIARRVAKQIGSKRNAATRAKQSAAAKGRKFSAEHCAKLSACAKLRMADPNHRRYLSEINTGRHPTPDTIAKMSAAQKGRKHSTETIAKMAATRYGYRHSAETKKKLSAAATRRLPTRSRNASGRFL